MIWINAVIAGGALYAGVKAIQPLKKKNSLAEVLSGKETSRTYYSQTDQEDIARTLRRKKRTYTLYLEAKETVQRIKKKIKRAGMPITVPFFSEDERSRQLKEISSASEQAEPSEAEKKANRYLALSSVTVGMATAGLLYSPLNLLTVPSLIYLYVPFYQDAYQSLFKDGEVRMSVLDSIFCAGTLITGYYFAGAVGAWFFCLSRKILLLTCDHSRQSLINVFGEQARVVWIVQDGLEIEVPFEAVKVAQRVVVHAGEMIPIDGTITEGVASIDQRQLTGESQPAEKGVGDQVFASTTVLSGRILIKVERAGKDTVAAQIGEILSRTADLKMSLQSRGEEISDKSALPTLVLSALALPIIGANGALAVLFSSFGYNMRVIAPISVLNFLQIASGAGILIKDGRALELLSTVDTIVFDKTGTLTEEEPHVGAIYTCGGVNENELLSYAAAAEYKQTHPIAQAIQKEARNRSLSLPEIEDARYEVGYGLKVSIKPSASSGHRQKIVRVGSARFMEMSGIAIGPQIRSKQEQCNKHGYSLVYVAIDSELSGAIELHATIRPEAKRIISELRQRGLAVYIISGDLKAPTQTLAQELGIDHYFAETLPENKADLISELQKAPKGHDKAKVVCFVGDGINDSIALKKANVSVSLRGASSIATDTAQIILMDGSLTQMSQLFDLADSLDANMNTNFITTIVPGVICIGGAFFFHFGILSSIILYNVGLVAGVANAMRPMINYRGKSQRSEGKISSPFLGG